jgi:hypothetical protein
MAEIPEMLSRPFPRFPLYGGGLLVLFSILLAGGVRLSGIDVAQPTVGKPVIVRELHFADRSDGGIVVSDAAAGDRVVEIVKPETGYFCARHCAAWRSSGGARTSGRPPRSA